MKSEEVMGVGKREFSYMLYLLGCGALGRTPSSPPDGTDMTVVFRYAEEHRVASLCEFAAASGRSPAEGVFASLSETARQRMTANSLRMLSICELFAAAKARTLRPLLVKGAAVAVSYAVPETRDSADVDIWIRREEESAMADLLSERGTLLAARTEKDHHGTWQCEGLGAVELHTDLLSEKTYRLWLDRDSRLCQPELPGVPLALPDGEVTMLRPTEQFLYLCLHTLFHCTGTGMGARMCADLAAFCAKYGDSIDYEAVRGELCRVKGLRLIATCFALLEDAGVTGVTPPVFVGQTDERTTELLSEDLRLGGHLGRNEYADRFRAMEKNADRRAAEKGSGFRFRFRLGETQRKVSRYLIPDRNTVRAAYPGKRGVAAYARYLRGNRSVRALAKSRSVSPEDVRSRREELLLSLGLLRDQ